MIIHGLQIHTHLSQSCPYILVHIQYANILTTFSFHVLCGPSHTFRFSVYASRILCSCVCAPKSQPRYVSEFSPLYLTSLTFSTSYGIFRLTDPPGELCWTARPPKLFIYIPIFQFIRSVLHLIDVHPAFDDTTIQVKAEDLFNSAIWSRWQNKDVWDHTESHRVAWCCLFNTSVDEGTSGYRRAGSVGDFFAPQKLWCVASSSFDTVSNVKSGWPSTSMPQNSMQLLIVSQRWKRMPCRY